MKHLKLFGTLSIFFLLAVWSLATIEVQTTVPLVDPDGTKQKVGSFRLIFSAPEFQAATAGTSYFLVRIQFSKYVELVSLGQYSVGDLDPGGPFIPVAWEQDLGALDPDTFTEFDWIRLVRNEAGFVDLLFYAPDMEDWGLSESNRLRCTIGTPTCTTPSDPQNNFIGEASVFRTECDPDGYYQEDTVLCMDFTGGESQTPPVDEFQFDDFWRVGITVYKSNEAAVVGTRYSVNFQPSDPSLAQKGQADQECDLEPYWPCKGDPCVFEDWTVGCMEPPEVHVCPTPPPPDQGEVITPCAGATLWINEIYDIEFGQGHMFSIAEDCPTDHYAFQPGGTLTVTLGSPYNEFGYTCSGLNPIFPLGITPSFYLFDPDAPGGMWGPFLGTRISNSVIEFVLPDAATWTTFDPEYGAYCLLVDLDAIRINTCCLLNFQTDDVFELRVNFNYERPNEYCGEPIGAGPFTVAYIYGCVEPDPEPVEYDLYLWFPFLAPVNNPAVNWWCGVALTNYAAQATEDGIFWMWEEDGDEYSIILPPLGAHEMWLRNLSDPDFQAAVLSPGYSDTLWGDEAMSGLVVYTVVDVDYAPNYAGGFVDDGAIAGIDAFVLMGDYEQAYGYTARHVDGAQIWNDAPGRAPGWAKKGTK